MDGCMHTRMCTIVTTMSPHRKWAQQILSAPPTIFSSLSGKLAYNCSLQADSISILKSGSSVQNLSFRKGLKSNFHLIYDGHSKSSKPLHERDCLGK